MSEGASSLPSARSSAHVQAAAGRSTLLAGEQLQRHADELALELRARQRELSKWEATIHARIARWEDEQRANRIWVSERTAELAERRRRLKDRADRLEQREAECERADRSAATLQARQIELDDRAACLEQLERRLQDERQRVQQQAAWLDAAQQDSARRKIQAEDRSADATSSRDPAAARDSESDTTQNGLPPANTRKLCGSGHSNHWNNSAGTGSTALTREHAVLFQLRKKWWERTQRQRRDLAHIWQRRRYVLNQRARTLQSEQKQLPLHDRPTESYDQLISKLVEHRRGLINAKQSAR